MYRVLKTSSTSEVGSMDGRISILGSVTGTSSRFEALPAMLVAVTAPTPGRAELGLMLAGLLLLPATLKRDLVFGLRMTDRDAADDESRDFSASIPEVVGARWGSAGSPASGGLPVWSSDSRMILLLPSSSGTVWAGAVASSTTSVSSSAAGFGAAKVGCGRDGE